MNEMGSGKWGMKMSRCTFILHDVFFNIIFQKTILYIKIMKPTFVSCHKKMETKNKFQLFFTVCSLSEK